MFLQKITALDKAPILLTPKNYLDKYIKIFLKNNPVRKIIIVDGEKSVSKNVENELRNLK